MGCFLLPNTSPPHTQPNRAPTESHPNANTYCIRLLPSLNSTTSSPHRIQTFRRSEYRWYHWRDCREDGTRFCQTLSGSTARRLDQGKTTSDETCVKGITDELPHHPILHGSISQRHTRSSLASNSQSCQPVNPSPLFPWLRVRSLVL